MSHLDNLNFEQREAVLHTKGPLLVLAGAGAGKTRVIAHRILEIVRQGTAPRNILAITFTNKAATEMRERVTNLLSTDRELNTPISSNERPFVSTFHSLGVHLIRSHARLMGFTRRFSIWDRSDSVSAVRDALRSEGLDPKRFEPGKILSVISREKGNMVTAGQFSESAGEEYFPGIVSAVWNRYEEALKSENALDFDDLLLKTAILLDKYEDIRRLYQGEWHYIHIDEYQDTNRVQYMIAKRLAEAHRNICVVGDIDQNIYSWRGADLRNILDFEQDYPDARIILLERNYRSTKMILAAANEVIRKNKRRREKNLFTDNVEGERIVLFVGFDETDEAHFVAESARSFIRGGVPASEIAVLYRANFQSRVLEEAMLAHDVPYQVLGTKFLERKEVKDLLSYLGAALEPTSLANLKRCVNAPPRGIGKVALLKILSRRESELTGRAREGFQQFGGALKRIAAAIKAKKPSQAVRAALAESGLEATLRRGNEDDMERLENLRELVTLASKYDYLSGEEGVQKLLDDAALATDQDALDEKKEGVKLMTVHAAKGLEFEHVFVTGLEEELFPHRSLAEDDFSAEREEEERRLFYVALTRAKRRLYLTYTASRTIFGSRRVNIPSEFLGDIDSSRIEFAAAREAENTKKVIFFD